MGDTDRLAALLMEGLRIFDDGDGHQTEYRDDEWRCLDDCPAHVWLARVRGALSAGVTLAPQPDEHRYVEVVDADGDDWYGCICGCTLAQPAPDALPAEVCGHIDGLLLGMIQTTWPMDRTAYEKGWNEAIHAARKKIAAALRAALEGEPR